MTDAEVWLKTTYPEMFHDWREAYLKPVKMEKEPISECRICQIRPNSGLHYGTFTCEADKQFLKRTFHDRLTYKICTLGCPPRFRGWCQYCRLRSSLLIGINLKMIRIGDKPRKGDKSPRAKSTKKYSRKDVMIKSEPNIKEEKFDPSPTTCEALGMEQGEKIYENYPVQQGFGTYYSPHKESAQGFRSYHPPGHLEGTGVQNQSSYTEMNPYSDQSQGFRSYTRPEQMHHGGFRSFSPEIYHDPNYFKMGRDSYYPYAGEMEGSKLNPEETNPTRPLHPTPLYQPEYIHNYWQHQHHQSFTGKWIHGLQSVSPTPSNEVSMFNNDQNAPLDLSSSSSSSSRPPSRPNSADCFSNRSSPRSRRLSDVGNSFNKMSVNSAVLQEALSLVQGTLSPGHLENISHVSDLLTE
jgi:hypothetical protein